MDGAAKSTRTAAAGIVSPARSFQRVWMQVDEIALLKSMVKFQATQNGADPTGALDTFYNFICPTMRVKFSKTQVSDKMRRLKKKYETNHRRSRKGADPAFAKSHDRVSFELSKKIWAPSQLAVPSPSDDRQDDLVVNAAAAHARDRALMPLVDVGDAGERARPFLREAINLLEMYSGNWLSSQLLTSMLEHNPVMSDALDERCGKHFLASVNLMLEQGKIKEDLLKCAADNISSILNR